MVCVDEAHSDSEMEASPVLCGSAPAGVNITSALLLLYTSVIVPVQILIWNYDDPCVMFPTLFFDMFVDVFFVVH